MTQKKQIVVYGLITFVAGFILLRWFLLTGLGLMAGSWFILDNLWILEPGETVNWTKAAKRVAAFVVLGLAADILLQV